MNANTNDSKKNFFFFFNKPNDLNVLDLSVSYFETIIRAKLKLIEEK